MKFEPSDFEIDEDQLNHDMGGNFITTEYAAEIANAKLESIKAEYELANQKLLDQLIELKAKIDLAPAIYLIDDPISEYERTGGWFEDGTKLGECSHRARLVDIEELK